MSRLPKPGEVWGGPLRSERRVVNVYPDAVTYMYDGSFLAMTLDAFVGCSTPPEPTVVDSCCIATYNDDEIVFPVEHLATHRLDLMSDGEFRVVKL